MNQEGLQVDEAENVSWHPTNDARPSDITLVVDAWQFHVHRDILVRSSDYFSAMFTSQMIESRESVVNLQMVNPEIFRTIAEAMYTDNFALTEANAFAVVEAAEMLQIRDPLKSVYINYLRNTFINASHCFDLMYFCVPLNLEELHCDARKYCLGHFSELKHSNALSSITLSELYDYLSDEHLVVDTEIEVVEAIYTWVCANKNTDMYSPEDYKLREKVKKLITECVTLKTEDEGTYDIITDAVFKDERLPVEHFRCCLSTRPRQEEVYMFWSCLSTSSNPDGLVDILKLNLDAGIAEKVGSMTQIVEKPGFQLGSAACHLGPYVYISGGGPNIGKVNWIRQIWRFDVTKLYSPWEIVGDLFEFRRNHAMVILENKLYIFGGFGKFRTKNSYMHSLDLATGDWEPHAPMPAHEYNPPATTSDNCIYYISADWTIHCYSLEARDWTQLNLVSPPFVNELHEVKPLTLYPFKAGETKCFAIATLVENTLKLQLLRTHKQTSTLHTLRDMAELANHFTYATCAGVNEKLVLFFTSQRSDDPFSGEDESSVTMQNAWSFDPKTYRYNFFPDVQNVRRALSIVALPYFPSVFRMACKELL